MIERTNSKVLRRTVLKQVGALCAGSSTVALAGCSGGGGGSGIACASEQVAVTAPAIGPSDAPSVEVFVDWSCPHCQDYHEEEMPELKEAAHEGKIQLIHRDFPLPVGDWSWPVAYLGRTVQDQVGNEAFWSFADEAFANQDSYSEDLLISIATDAGLSEAIAARQLEETNYCTEVNEDRQRAEDLKIGGTPAIYANKTKYTAISADKLLETMSVSISSNPN